MANVRAIAESALNPIPRGPVKRILVFDPGDSTGWVIRDRDGKVGGGTIYKNFKAIEFLFEIKPDVVVFESFRLYAGAAKHLINDEFYTVQVIGAIKLLCMQHGIVDVVPQAPSVKKYSGGLDARWRGMLKDGGVTEHIKDAYMHLRFYEKFGERAEEKKSPRPKPRAK